GCGLVRLTPRRWQGQQAEELRFCRRPRTAAVGAVPLPCPVLLRFRRRLLSPGPPDVLHEGDAFFAQDALYATNGVALAVEKVSHAVQQVDVVGPVVAPPAAPFQRPDLREAAFPEAQDMLRNVDLLGHLADRAECVRRLFQFPRSPIVTRSSRDRHLPASLLPSGSELIRCLRMAESLDPMTRRGAIGTSLPVLGLRPMRWPFLRTTNEPNDDSFTVSPRSRQSVISLSTSSTSVADSVRDKPTFW